LGKRDPAGVLEDSVSAKDAQRDRANAYRMPRFMRAGEKRTAKAKKASRISFSRKNTGVFYAQRGFDIQFFLFHDFFIQLSSAICERYAWMGLRPPARSHEMPAQAPMDGANV